MATITETDLDRIEHLAAGDGLSPASTPFDTWEDWLAGGAAGQHFAQHAAAVTRLIKVRAVQRAAARAEAS